MGATIVRTGHECADILGPCPNPSTRVLGDAVSCRERGTPTRASGRDLHARVVAMATSDRHARSPMRPLQDTPHPEEPRVEQGGRAPGDAHAEKKRRLEEVAQQLDRVSRLISTFRLITLAGAVLLGFLRGFGYLPEWVLVVAIALAAAFVVLVVWHIRLDRKERRVAAAIAFHHWAIERIAGRFQGYPSRGDRFVSDAHPYSADLGIFGEAS